MAAKRKKRRTETQRARLQRLMMDVNEQLMISAVRQHELTTAAEKLNDQLQAEITERKQAEEALRQAQAQLADRAIQLEGLVAERTAKLTTAHKQLLAQADERKRLEGQIAHAVEREQQRLGQELHDGLAQELTAAAMILDTLERDLVRPSPTHASQLRRVSRMLSETANKARDLARGFYPVELETHGLGVALQELARRTQEAFGISCAVETDKHAPARSKDARAIQLFRIAQEAVHNATKHSRARHILIRLTARDGASLLTVKDDGVGLRPARRRAGGMGMHIMQHRVGLIGGKLEVRNANGGGVIVSCAVPEPKEKRKV